MLENWRYVYSSFDPVAFKLFGLSVHWYGLMYVSALLGVYMFARYLAKKDGYPFSKEDVDAYFFWAEIGVILGARLGYVLFYDPHALWYITHPWQIFNPFMNGEFVGIRGFSYHGGLVGFLLASYLWCKKNGKSFWLLMDLTAVSAGLGYTFGRIGNFLNQELVGRVTDSPLAILVGNELRHPSQLYEAFFEGVVVFAILYSVRLKKTFDGQLAMLYGVLYGLFRAFCEFFREPDPQIGYLVGSWLTMGMLLSFVTAIIAAVMYEYIRRKAVDARGAK